MELTAVSPKAEQVISLATTTKIVLIMEYDGTHYYGFQLQANLPTIQMEMEKALWRLTGEKIRVRGASRTDTGVHAKGQVVSFMTHSLLPQQTFVKGLNYYLPRDIAVKSAHRVREPFDARRDANSREYNYYILNSVTRSPIRQGFSYLVTHHLNIEAMNRASQALVGKYDFASFATCISGTIKNTVRNVYRAEVKKDGELVVFNMVASCFLPHQVRNTAGALIRVGLGKMSVEEFCGMIEMKKAGLAGPTAPAGGLCLMQIKYPHPFEEEMS